MAHNDFCEYLFSHFNGITQALGNMMADNTFQTPDGTTISTLLLT